MMRPEDVPTELVEKGSAALSMLRHGIPGEYSDHTRTEVRHALAAVLPDAVGLLAQEVRCVIQNGDVAEIAAFAPGETGRQAVIDARDLLQEDPGAWLEQFAARMRAG